MATVTGDGSIGSTVVTRSLNDGTFRIDTVPAIAGVIFSNYEGPTAHLWARVAPHVF